jgi:hypothetical protein
MRKHEWQSHARRLGLRELANLAHKKVRHA